jgi:hypothetical protein
LLALSEGLVPFHSMTYAEGKPGFSIAFFAVLAAPPSISRLSRNIILSTGSSVYVL